ncbi:MAG: hypothetical protein GWM98_20410, partial [Nitrospinaceae bacterium]|nr:hypothetical protein [Nitrospinaceae bacterium]NIR56400.1 hypothetical protein [Nitrospinaceae bacterium]NIS86864.1 hypothetical protein [Nitrospinaceae bacterium]NIT83700.1 hypothetical protein [Nitrospinaceae bacterium]NIU45896.1 hypothetical protein [Nitrospinaceae bacterium]
AVAVYSRMNPDQIQVPPPEPEDFFLQDEPPLAPQYPLAAMDPSFFFSQCLARIQNGRRQEAIRWE